MMLAPSDNPILLDALDASDMQPMPPVRIAKSDVEKQIVYGVVYAPGEVDAHGEVMFAEDIEEMCHNFMRLVATKGGAVIDTEHNNNAVSAYPVECYIEEGEDKDWPCGSWIMGVKIEDPVIWAKVKSGEFNAYSFEAMVNKVATVAEIELHADAAGRTAKALDHDHVFLVEYDEHGRIVFGETSFDEGHRHTILSGSTTEPAAAPGLKPHTHRLVMVSQ